MATVVWESESSGIKLEMFAGPKEGDSKTHLRYELIVGGCEDGEEIGIFLSAQEVDSLALAIMKPHDEDVSI